MPYSDKTSEEGEDFVVKLNKICKNYSLTVSGQSRLVDILFPSEKKTNGFSALKNVSLNINKGEVLGIIGRNGSGKSTLLEIITGVLEPSSGSVEKKGKIAALLQLGAGFNPEFTGRENVMFYAALSGLSKREILGKFSEIEKFADIGLFIDQPMKTYSSGMYARLAFSASIHVSPDIFIIDEILAVGDEVFQRKCFAKIEEIKRQGTTILFVSHSGTSIINLCDRVILLHQGELLFNGEPKKGVYYLQKIGNSADHEIQDVLEEIRQNKTHFIEIDKNEENNNHPTLEKSENKSHKMLETNTALFAEDHEEFYDNSLTTLNTSLSYNPKGAIILSAQLMTTDSVQVNNIVNSRKYKFKVECEFFEDCPGVRAYALIRTTDGIDLAGCAYPRLNTPGFLAKKGSKLTIDFEFKCMLNQGTYFCNFALQALDGSLHHRIVDALVFRVMAISHSHVTGLADLEYSPQLYII